MNLQHVLENPLVAAVLGALAAALIALIKHGADLAHKRLELEALKVATQIEMVSQQRKRTIGTATPSSTKLTLAKDELKRSISSTRSMLPPPSEAAITAAVEAVMPHVHAIRDAVKRDSEQPLSDGSDVPTVPRRSPTGFSGDSFPAVLPKDVATLDDGDDQ